MDSRIRFRTKMSWIRNTALLSHGPYQKLFRRKPFVQCSRYWSVCFWAIRIRNYFNLTRRRLFHQQAKNWRKPLKSWEILDFYFLQFCEFLFTVPYMLAFEYWWKCTFYVNFSNIFNINFTFVFPSFKCLRLHITRRYKLFRYFYVLK